MSTAGTFPFSNSIASNGLSAWRMTRMHLGGGFFLFELIVPQRGVT